MNELIATQPQLATDIGETTETAWIAPANMTYEEYESVGRTLQQVGRSLNWWIGDWLNYGERKFGEMYAQALAVTGLSLESLTKYKAVAARIRPEIRIPELSWTHHFTVAWAEESLREPLLQMAYYWAISSRDLKQLMRLSPYQLRELIKASDSGDLEDRQAFNQAINNIRLEVPEKPPTTMVNGKSARELLAEAEAADEEEPNSYQQQRLVDDGIGGQVYIEEVMAAFDDKDKAPKMKACKSDEAVWDNGLFVLAALDHRGRPYLKWGRNAGG